MKYIITDKNNVILEISNIYELDKEHRNIRLDNYKIAYAPNEKMDVYEVEEVPNEVVNQKYCYTEEEGFYKNENYKEPEPTNEEKIKDLQEQITNLQLALAEIVEGGM